VRTADAILYIGALLIAWSLYRAHKNRDEFNVFDLVMVNKRFSRIAVAFMVTLVVTSWIMIRLTIDGKMDSGYFVGYGAMWVAPIIARMFSSQPTVETKEPEAKT